MAELTTTPALPQRPALSPWFRLLPGDDQLLLEHGGTVIAFEGKAAGLLLPSLLPLLDGTRTVEEIVAILGESIAPATRNALELLNSKGALLEGPQPSRSVGPLAEAAVFTAALSGGTAAQAHATLTTSQVAIAGSSPVAAEVARILASTGLERIRPVEIVDRVDGAEFLIAIPADDELGHLRSVNARCLELETPWLQVLPNDGHLVVIGPLLVPGVSGCHTCYRLRRGACSGFEDDFEGIASVPPRAGSPSPLVAVTAGLVGLLTLRWLGANDSTLPGSYYTIETGVVLGLGYGRLLRVPRCPDCGAGGAPMPSPWFNAKAPGD